MIPNVALKSVINKDLPVVIEAASNLSTRLGKLETHLSQLKRNQDRFSNEHSSMSRNANYYDRPQVSYENSPKQKKKDFKKF